ncbi:DUF4010 domain-containing protein [Actinomycetospora cinnamomea]|uniref:Uncharacterized membrane protein (DUF4010 family) n=1 Tax=Actinomycetospora cinnamomea TaxID=663609 RepID=A0A2U1F2C2_9PSEU|nr:DUF4010 domain-containing protein [Actinomycetospora cinnamomea]PVZ06316.1 uncharacterized membrane protein (DUF4010 family) [Actinomycetospora cinnamomea]
MDTVTALAHVGTALAIGLLVGLEREHSARHDLPRPSAGARTFALLAVTGAVATALGVAVLVAGLAAVTVLMVVGYLAAVRTAAEPDLGATTEVAAVGTYLLGALAWTRPSWAVAIGVGVVVVLAVKRPLHDFATRLVTDQDVGDALRLFVVALVVLPLLPDRPLGPYGVLNPSRIWLLVVALTVVGWVGYVGVRALGERIGLLLVGFLGGFVSASATTLVLARRRRRGEVAPAVMPAVLAANVATLVQLVVVVAVASPAVALRLLPAAGAGVVVLLAEIAWLWRRTAGAPAPAEDPQTPADENHPAVRPLSLTATLTLAALLVVLLLGTRLAAELAGSGGVAVAAVVGGLADAHAASVAAATLAGTVIPVATAAAAAGLALAANTATKLALALAAGGARFAGRLTLLLAAPVAAVATGIALVP